MGFGDPKTVDIIIKRPSCPGYDLVVMETVGNLDEIARYQSMLDKLTAYAAFVASGQLWQLHPEAKGMDIRFVVFPVTAPNDAMTAVEAIKPRDDPSHRFPVVFSSQEEYLAAEGNSPAQPQRRSWWQMLRRLLGQR